MELIADLDHLSSAIKHADGEAVSYLEALHLEKVICSNDITSGQYDSLEKDNLLPPCYQRTWMKAIYRVLNAQAMAIAYTIPYR